MRLVLPGPPNLLKVLAAGSNSSDALFKFTPAQNTDGIAAAAAGGLEGLQLITRRDRYGKSASQPSSNQVHMLMYAQSINILTGQKENSGSATIFCVLVITSL